GVAVRALDELWLASEIYGDTIPAGRTDAMTHSHVLSPIEWLAGVRWKPDRRFTFRLAARRGLTRAVRTPALRRPLSLSFTPRAPRSRIVDTDGDGIPDKQDRCPNEAEDKNGIKDNDGCPDGDLDRDGIVDARDKCPRQAEDKDGYQDDDGCPELDND